MESDSIKGCSECHHFKCGRINYRGDLVPNKCKARFQKRMHKWMDENSHKIKGKDKFVEMQCYKPIHPNPLVRFFEMIL